MNTPIPAIKIEHLTKKYKRNKADPVVAVDNLSLTVPAGQIFGFLGSNGAGKTTTIKMCCGLITPSVGQIWLNGYDIARQRGEASRQIGVVLEGTRNIYWRLSAWDNLMYFGQLKGCLASDLKPRAERMLVELDLWDRRKDVVGTFSRGMQQKVAIACALISDPPIVMLDEPTLGLDVQAARVVESWVYELARKQGKTVVLTTHQLDMAQKLCDHIAIMSRGHLIANEPKNTLLKLQEDYYTIKIDQATEKPLPQWASTLNVTVEDSQTTITGPIEGQDALHRLIQDIHNAGLPLISINRVEPNLEEVFVKLSKGGK